MFVEGMHFDLLIEHLIIQFTTRRRGRLTLSLTSLLKVTRVVSSLSETFASTNGCGFCISESSLLLQSRSELKIKSLWLVKEQRV